MGKSKKMKNDKSSSADNSKTSLLPKDAQAILQRGMTEGFKHPQYGDGYLDFGNQ